MPTPFHFSDLGNQNMNSQSVLNNDNADIDQDDPSKIFAELTEIGHGNFGAVYYVSISFVL